MYRSYGIRICLWHECKQEFDAIRSNMVYCTKECCRKATNQKIIERYHATKASRSITGRVCEDCNSKLSKYNEDNICNPCKLTRKDSQRIDLLKKLGFAYYED